MANVNTYEATPRVLSDMGYTEHDSVDPVNRKQVTTAPLNVTNDKLQAFPPKDVTTGRITTATTTTILASAGWVRLRVQNGTMGATTVYDNTAGSGDIKFTGTPAAKDVIFHEWTWMVSGCTIVTAAATEIFYETLTVPA